MVRAGHAHVLPQPERAETYRLLVLKESQAVDRMRSEMCELSENHLNRSS